MSTRPQAIKFQPLTKESDVREKDTPTSIRAMENKSHHMVYVAEALFKEANGSDRSLPADIAKLISSYSETPLKLTGILGKVHIHKCNERVLAYFRNFSARVHFDVGVERDRHSKGFIALDTSISELFRDGISSISFTPEFYRCDKLETSRGWMEIGVAECEKKDEIDGVLNTQHKLLAQSTKGLIRKLRSPFAEDGLKVPDGWIPVINWVEFKIGMTGHDCKMYHGFDGRKFVKYPHLTRDLTVEEKRRKFSVSIKKLTNEQIMIDNLVVDLKDKKNEFYAFLKDDICSCKAYTEPSGFVWELSCHY